jgi:multicomponent Na+:H+ antiporter subunit F
MFETILYIALFILTIAIVGFLIRIFIGPSITDRVMGLDALGITLVGFIGVIMIVQDSIAYSDVILVISILSFVGTISLTKFIERGAIFDDD